MDIHEAIETYIVRQAEPQLYRHVYKKLKAFHQEGDPMAIFIFARHCARKYSENEDLFAEIAEDIERGIRRAWNWQEPKFKKAKVTFSFPCS